MSAAVLLVLLLGGLYIAVQRYSDQAADEAYDRVLGAAALSIADTVEIQGANVIVDIPYAAFSILATSRLNRVFYRVVSPDGSLVTGAPTLALEAIPAQNAQLRYFNSFYQGVPVRVAAVGRFREGAGGGGWVDIIVAETREARSLLSDQLAVNALLPTFAIAVLSYLLIIFAVRWAFVPLRSIEAQIRSRAASDLSPITGNIPAEAQQLVGALNEFMVRLESTLSGLKRVTADAAHQLRTPITALRALTEVTLDDVPDGPLKRRLRRIHHNSVSASLLASQLLSDATVLHSLETKVHERVDLGTILAESVKRAEIESGPEKASRLKFTAPIQPVVVMGDPLALREMIKNLIDNALVYSEGPVDLQLEIDTDYVRAIIADRGPGILNELKSKMFERFARGDVAQAGSGLGLSIAKNVATALGGHLDLKDRQGGGLWAEATFPAAKRVIRSHIPTALLMVAALVLSGFGLANPSQAQTRTAVTLASTVPIEQIQPLIDGLEKHGTGYAVTYRQ
ncbi:MAG: sensor histidine kinase, partial [Pseudorhodobacter sp.]